MCQGKAEALNSSTAAVYYRTIQIICQNNSDVRVFKNLKILYCIVSTQILLLSFHSPNGFENVSDDPKVARNSWKVPKKNLHIYYKF